MKYVRFSRAARIAMICLMILWLGVMGHICVLFWMLGKDEWGNDIVPLILTILMIGAAAFVVRLWLYTITEVEWDGTFLTFTYLTGKKETVAASDIIQVEVRRRCYVLRTRRKVYNVTRGYHYSSMAYDEIPFLRQMNFPHAYYKRQGW